MSENSKNTHLFYRLYSTPGQLAQSGFVCLNRVDETDTSFDISGSNGVITDSNGEALAKIDLSEIHAAGITEYMTETKIIGPQSAYLVMGNVTGETYAAQFFPVPQFIQAQDGYQSFINLKFCIQYVACSAIQNAKIDTYLIRTEPGDVCEMIQNRFKEMNIPVAVSIRTLEVCDCEHAGCKQNNMIDYIVFQSEIAGYQFFVYDMSITAIDYSYKNHDGTWADYTESPFVAAQVDFDTVLDIIRSVSPRKKGKSGDKKPYGQVPCDLYRWLITLAPTAVNDADVFSYNYRVLDEFAKLADETGVVPEDNWQKFIFLGNMYPDIYRYYWGMDDGLCNKYNIHDLLEILRAVSIYVMNSNTAGEYKMVEDYSKRIYPQKYPNGAFRGICMIPNWPSEGNYEALKIAHVADSIVVNEQIQLPKGMRLEGYVCGGCKDVFIRHEAEVKVNCVLQSELEVYQSCGCAMPIRKVVSEAGVYNSLDDDIWTATLHLAVESTYGSWTSSPEYMEGDPVWSDYTPHPEHQHTEDDEPQTYEDYVEESRTPSKYDWLANIPSMDKKPNMEPFKRSVGLYRYMQHLSENLGWLNVGDGYIIIGPEDDYQSNKHNLQNSLLVYNPNNVPIRVHFLVFS